MMHGQKNNNLVKEFFIESRRARVNLVKIDSVTVMLYLRAQMK